MKGKCIGRAKEQAVHKRHQNGENAMNISRALNISPSTVRRCIERLVEFREGRRPSPYSGNWKPARSVPEYQPTPEEIAKGCAEALRKRREKGGGGGGADGVPGIRQYSRFFDAM